MDLTRSAFHSSFPLSLLSSLEGLVRPLSARHGLTSSPPSLRHRSWHPIYPIYLDAKRAFGTSGGRRIPREKAHWWPLVGDLVKGLKALRLPVFVEVRCPFPPLPLTSYTPCFTRPTFDHADKLRLSIVRKQAHKTHPKDWENPGRVKTEYLKDGVPINPSITNRSSSPSLPSPLLLPASLRTRADSVVPFLGVWGST